MSNPKRPAPVRYRHTCPICDAPLIAVGFCHLRCAVGHYQEVCSDLFVPAPLIPPHTLISSQDEDDDQPAVPPDR